MPMGRPSKPTELKRRTGNPGRRPLPNPISVLPVIQNGPPPTPKGLGPSGRKLWKRAWALGRVWLSPTTDLDILTRLAQAHDERDMLRKTIVEEGYFTTGSMNQ